MAHGRCLTPPVGGEVLRQVRLAQVLSQSDIAPWYGTNGVTSARICQIEKSALVNKVIESFYRAAVDTAVSVRDRRLGALNLGTNFENPKMPKTER